MQIGKVNVFVCQHALSCKNFKWIVVDNRWIKNSEVDMCSERDDEEIIKGLLARVNVHGDLHASDRRNRNQCCYSKVLKMNWRDFVSRKIIF